MSTGVDDVDITIYNFLDDKEMLKLSLVNKYLNELLKKDHFWIMRIINKFGGGEGEKKEEREGERTSTESAMKFIGGLSPKEFYLDLSKISFDGQYHDKCVSVRYLNTTCR